METMKNFKEWRSEEIAKLNLLQSSRKLIIEQSPSIFFDFLITLGSNKKVKFGVEVKESNSFTKYIQNHAQKLKTYRDSGMINLPALVIKVNEMAESGEVDFLIVPAKSGNLLIRQNFHFKKLSPDTIDTFIEKIENWWILYK